MKVTVVGAGNIGTQFAAHCAAKGHEVTVYTSKPGKIARDLLVVGNDGKSIVKGSIHAATNDPETAFSSAELVFVTMPAYCLDDLSAILERYVQPGCRICLVPGTGGGECAMKKCLDKGAVVFGLQRVPSVARLKEYGKCVCAVGYRQHLYAAALPQAASDECARLIEGIFDIACSALPGYLNVTMTPSNPLLHTARLRVLYKQYRQGFSSERVPLFYQEWDDESSELLLLCDRELQEVCKMLSCFDLSFVKSLKEHYESDTPQQLTRKIQSIEGFKGLVSPAVRQEDGTFVPDLTSRYFTADFPYGLKILLQIAAFAGAVVPNMRSVYDWYVGLTQSSGGFSYADHGIKDAESFKAFYGG